MYWCLLLCFATLCLRQQGHTVPRPAARGHNACHPDVALSLTSACCCCCCCCCCCFPWAQVHEELWQETLSVLVGMLEQLLLDAVDEHKANATSAAPGTPPWASADAQAPQVPAGPSAHRSDLSGPSSSREAAGTAAGNTSSHGAAGGPGGMPSPAEQPGDERTRWLIEAAYAAMGAMPEGQHKAAVYAAASLLAGLARGSGEGAHAAAMDHLWHTFAFGTWPLTWLCERRAGLLASAIVAANPALAVLAPPGTATAATGAAAAAAAGMASVEEATKTAASAVGSELPVVVQAGRGSKAAAAAAKAAVDLAARKAGAPGGSGVVTGGGGGSRRAKKGKGVAGQAAAGGLRSDDGGDEGEDFEEVDGTKMGKADLERFEQCVPLEDDLRRHLAVGGRWGRT